MREKVIALGETNHLVGIMTWPDTDNQSELYPAVILLNAGLVHRVGPNRIYVKIARRLARAGLVVFRFDLSGIGDSRTRNDNLPYEQRVISETQRVMDLLAATQGVQHFILMGICSGADNSLRVACNDNRVIGAVLIDSYPFSTGKFHLYQYRNHFFKPQSWSRFISGKSDLWGILKINLRKILTPQSERQTYSLIREGLKSPRGRMISELHALVEKNVQLFFIYSGNGPSYYNYRLILKKEMDSLPSSRKPQVRYFGDSDHTFTLLSNQQLLVDAIHDWVRTINKRKWGILQQNLVAS